MKLSLPNVTLLGIDCVNVERLQKALDISSDRIEFGAVKLLTSLPTSDVRKVEIPHIGSIDEYSRFVIGELYQHVDTEYVLLVQYDGFVLNPDAWENAFLEYDYIGAPWFVADWSVKNFDFPKEMIGTYVVGNGGFSLRSKRFLDTCAQLAQTDVFDVYHPEDVALCVWHRHDLEKVGMKFAPTDIALRFSYEGDGDLGGKDDIYTDEFGFHGFRWTDIANWTQKNPQWEIQNSHISKNRLN
ncbi:MAG: DUF5672 family protein [Minisyncoccia bacterium]